MVIGLLAGALLLAPPPEAVPVQRPQAVSTPVPPEPSTATTHPDVPPPAVAPGFEPPAGNPTGGVAPPPAPAPAPAPPPVVVQPPPVAPAPLPPPLPPAPVPFAPPPKPPPSGAGMLVGGTLMTLGGITLITVTTIGIARNQSQEARLSAAFGYIPGFALGISGAILMSGGAKTRRRHNEWIDRTGIQPPPQGSGLVVAGISAIVPGIATAATAGVMSLDPVARQAPVPATLAVISIACFVGGGTMLGVGIARAKRHSKWTKGAHVNMPVAAPIRGGGMVALSGSF